MITINEYVGSVDFKKNVVKDKREVKVDWGENFSGVIRYVKDSKDEWVRGIKEDIREYIIGYYDQYKRKLKASKTNELSVVMSFNIDDKDFNNLYSLYSKIGMDAWWNKLIDPQGMTLLTMSITGEASSRSAVADIKNIKWSYRKYEPSLSQVKLGNGYNSLPADVIVKWKEILLDSIKEARVEKIKFGDNMIIKITPVVNDSMIKKIYNDISKDRELMTYAEVLSDKEKGLIKEY